MPGEPSGRARIPLRAAFFLMFPAFLLCLRIKAPNGVGAFLMRRVVIGGRRRPCRRYLPVVI